MTPTDLIETEEEIRALWEQGDIPSLLHLEGSVDGSYERFLCDYFRDHVGPDDWVCASHRCHYVWQLQAFHQMSSLKVEYLNGNDLRVKLDLISYIKAGKSMFLYGPRFICSAIVAGTASIGVGLALAIQRKRENAKVHVFGGDGCLEHGHTLESIFYAHSKSLPITFIISDNDSSCGVTKTQRRGSNNELNWPPCVLKVNYKPKFPHAGTSVRPNLKWKPKCDT